MHGMSVAELDRTSPRTACLPAGKTSRGVVHDLGSTIRINMPPKSTPRSRHTNHKHHEALLTRNATASTLSLDRPDTRLLSTISESLSWPHKSTESRCWYGDSSRRPAQSRLPINSWQKAQSITHSWEGRGEENENKKRVIFSKKEGEKQKMEKKRKRESEENERREESGKTKEKKKTATGGTNRNPNTRTRKRK